MRWNIIDKLVSCEPGVRAEGVKCFSPNDRIFLDHFPGFPIVPGVLQIEMIAQTGGKSIRIAHPEILPVLGKIKSAKFFRAIAPNDICNIRAEVTSLRKDFAVVSGTIEVAGEKVSDAEIMFALIASSNLDPNHKDSVIEEWRGRQAGVSP